MYEKKFQSNYRNNVWNDDTAESLDKLNDISFKKGEFANDGERMVGLLEDAIDRRRKYVSGYEWFKV